MRDAMPIMARYEAQIMALPMKTDVYICEGKSGDGTKEWLRTSPLKPVVVHDDNEGVHSFSHLEDPARWRTLTNAWNKATHSIPYDVYDVVVLLECELVWTPTTLLECIDNLQDYDVIAPGLWCGWDHNRFYDTNAFRTPSGEKWSNSYPYFPGYSLDQRFYPVSSVGGMIVMRGELLSEIEWRDTCRLHYPPGTKVYADMSLRVWHP